VEVSPKERFTPRLPAHCGAGVCASGMLDAKERSEEVLEVLFSETLLTICLEIVGSDEKASPPASSWASDSISIKPWTYA